MKTEERDQFLPAHPELVRMIRDLPDEVHAVILFGSQTTGRATPISDTDICFVTAHRPGPDIQHTLLSFGSKTVQVSLFSDLPPLSVSVSSVTGYSSSAVIPLPSTGHGLLPCGDT